MESLKQALSMERSRLFVGREAEIEHVRQWLTQPSAPTEMVFVSGMGGIGKSALLLKFLSMANETEVLCIWIDGRSCSPSPSGFIDAMHAYLFQGSRLRSVAPLAEVLEYICRHRTLLCIDNYEHLNHIEGWLREVFLPELPAADLFVVFASRQMLSVEWQNDMAWRGRVRHMHLQPLSRTEAQVYYRKCGCNDPSKIRNLVHETQGYPLAMAFAADSVSQTAQTPIQSTWPVGHVVSSQLLREVSSCDLHEALDVLCILPQATQELLNRLLQVPMTVRQFHRLSQLSFVRPTTEGIAVHDVARAHLLEDFLRREPERFQTLRRRVVEEVCEDLAAAHAHEKSRIAATLLSICRDAVPLSSQYSFSADPVSTAFDIFRKEDLPHLHTLLEEEEIQKAISLESNEKAHELLDDLAEQFPESIHVFRSPEGIPLVFHAGLLLYGETWSFLQRYIPGVLEACFPMEAQRMSNMRHEEADTYYHFLGGADHHDSSFPFNELYGYMFTDGFARSLGVGIRLTGTMNWESLKELFTSLGYQKRHLDGLPPSHPAHDDVFFELDLRKADFGEWVKSFLDDHVAVRPTVLPKDLKDALSMIGDSMALERTSVALWLNRTGRALQDILRQLLDSTPPTAPLTPSSQRLLQLLTSEPYLSADDAAERLHISRATYYRHLRDALDQGLRSLNHWRS